ncbi:MAG: cytidine deaminase [Anaerolineae bacterium]|nr:cytidine deaminase [Anaerolineae bacterium]
MNLSQEQKADLVRIAKNVRKWAYAPYSKYKVGAALLTESGKVYEGVNVENAAFPVTNCAERTAVFTAVANGETKFQAIAVVTENGGAPCGSCRQVLAEFGTEILVITADEHENIVSEKKLIELLPGAFTPADLP